jgi:hypothetical protein
MQNPINTSTVSVIFEVMFSMKISLFLIMGGITVLVLFTAACTAPQQVGIIPTVPTTPAGSSSCGFTSCHGLDLACGNNPPQVCTALYQLGDKCRQLAYCSDAGGSCTLVRTAAFDTCKSCVEQCGGADATEQFTCEEQCR